MENYRAEKFSQAGPVVSYTTSNLSFWPTPVFFHIIPHASNL